MKTLLHLITLRHLLNERSRTLLTILGVGLGVSVYLAIRLANQSILSSFHESIDSISGKATLQIQGESIGFDENFIKKIRKQPGISHLAPLIETLVGIEEFPGKTLRVLGIDPLAEKAIRKYHLNSEGERSDLFLVLLDPSSILLTKKFMEQYRLKLGESITLLHNQKKHLMTIKGALEPLGPAKAQGGYLAFMDISTAQWVFNKLGKLDRIDLITDPNIPVEKVQKDLQDLLPPHLLVQRPKSRRIQVEGMLRSFQLNLNMTGGIALLVALFLVHNTMTLAVAKRRKEIGMLRAIGVTKNQVLALMTMEGIILGGLGSVLGLGLGLILAQGTLQVVSKTVSSLYIPHQGESLFLSPTLILEAMLIGLGVSLLSVLAPAFEASRTQVRETLQSGFFEKKPTFTIGLRTFLGLIFIPSAFYLAFQENLVGSSYNGYLSAFILLLGSVFLVPALASTFYHLVAKTRRAPSLFSLALTNINASLQRTSSAVTPLLVALALMIGILIMVTSFRKTVEQWIHETIRADLMVVSPSWGLQGSNASLPEEIVENLEGFPGVLATDGYREIRIHIRGEPVNLVARDLEVHNRFSRYLFLEGDSSSLLEAARKGEGLLLSETLSNRLNIKKDDTLALNTPTGTVELPVIGVFYDYSTDGGRILMDRRIYRRYWPQDNRVNVIALYLSPLISSEEFRRAMNAKTVGTSFATINNQELRAGVLEVFDQTFAITYAMELIALLIGLLGIFNTLLTSILDRKRELGILRAIGMSKTQLVKMILMEGASIGLIGALLGGGAGIGLSWILVEVINKQAFGWTIHFSPFPSFLIVIFLLVLLTAVLASLFPAKRALAIKISEAVHYE